MFTMMFMCVVVVLLNKQCTCFKEWWEDSKVIYINHNVFIYWS